MLHSEYAKFVFHPMNTISYNDQMYYLDRIENKLVIFKFVYNSYYPNNLIHAFEKISEVSSFEQVYIEILKDAYPYSWDGTIWRVSWDSFVFQHLHLNVKQTDHFWIRITVGKDVYVKSFDEPMTKEGVIDWIIKNVNKIKIEDLTKVSSTE